jgi:hypothetical protein
MNREARAVEVKKIKPQKRQSSLETANEMYKAAYQVKKMRFAEKNPQLTDQELNILTAKYFCAMDEGKK